MFRANHGKLANKAGFKKRDKVLHLNKRGSIMNFINTE